MTYTVAIVAIVFFMGGYYVWTAVQSQPQTTSPTPTPTQILQNDIPTNATNDDTPDESIPVDNSSIILSEVEQARNNAILYLQSNHPEVLLIVPEGIAENSFWNISIEGQNYVFNDKNMSITVQFFDFSRPTIISIKLSGEQQITWQGTNQNGIVTETKYTSNIKYAGS